MLPMRVEARPLAEEPRAFKGLAPLQRACLTKLEQKKNIALLVRRLNVMLAALGTLPFLATLWLLVVLGNAVLEESGAKIAAALKGEPPRRQIPVSIRVRMRSRPQPMRVEPRLRAAA